MIGINEVCSQGKVGILGYGLPQVSGYTHMTLLFDKTRPYLLYFRIHFRNQCIREVPVRRQAVSWFC